MQDESAEKEATPSKRKTIAEKKLDFTEAITANANPKANESSNPKIPALALYVDEKLSELNKRTRRIAEKRISDVLFDIEMSTDVSTDWEFSCPQLNPYSRVLNTRGGPLINFSNFFRPPRTLSRHSHLLMFRFEEASLTLPQCYVENKKC